MRFALILILYALPEVTYAGTPWIGDMGYIFFFLLGILIILISFKPVLKWMVQLARLATAWWRNEKQDMGKERG
ncbi:MAG: hypothetical protein ACR2MX_12025 [Cyclobacteriaceae bacterium]